MIGKEPTVCGYSLMSLIIALAITAVLAAAAGHGLSRRLAHEAADGAAALALQALSEGRQYALRHGRIITVCNGQDADPRGGCVDQASHTLALHNGEPGKNTLLQLYIMPTSRGTLNIRAALRKIGLQFDRDGSARIVGSIFYCPTQGPEHDRRRVILSPSGTARLATGAAQDPAEKRDFCPR